MKTIPSRITLHHGRPPIFQCAPELLTDVVVPKRTRISRKWVIIGSAEDIERIIESGGATEIEVGGSRWLGDRDRRRHGQVTRVTLVGIVGIRYVNHREHGRTRYLAASVKRHTAEEKMTWYQTRGQTPRR